MHACTKTEVVFSLSAHFLFDECFFFGGGQTIFTNCSGGTLCEKKNI